MVHAQAHAHGGRDESRVLGLILGLTAAYALAELVGGWLSNSLALLADAGHMLTDIMALALALVAARMARRPPDPSRTYGYKRVEILAALFNGVALILIALFIFHEAWERMSNPPDVRFGLMASVAAGGLVVNVIGAVLLHGRHRGMNVRAVYLHVMGDLLGSVGTLLAAAGIGFYGWRWADPVVSVVIGLVIVFGAVRLVLDSVNVLLEGAPAHLDTQEIRDALVSQSGFSGVHDLHVWSLGGDVPLLSAHLVLDGTRSSTRALREATAMLRDRFGIDHSTLQLEAPDYNIIQTLTPTLED